MTTYEPDAWDALASSGSGIEGQWLKCVKGHWSLDGEPVQTGENGLRMAILMDSAIVGEVLWQDKKIVSRNTGLVSAGFVAPYRVADGWNAYASFQCVRADEDHVGDLITFTSSSYGGPDLLRKLAKPYQLRGQLEFPIVWLSTHTRNDANSTVDPATVTCGWTNRKNFPDLVAPEPPNARALSAPNVDAVKSIKQLVDDDIPF